MGWRDTSDALMTAFFRKKEMNKLSFMIALTAILGSAVAVAANPCGEPQGDWQCQTQTSHNGYCTNPYAKSETCQGDATKTCVVSDPIECGKKIKWDSASGGCIPDGDGPTYTKDTAGTAACGA